MCTWISGEIGAEKNNFSNNAWESPKFGERQFVDLRAVKPRQEKYKENHV